ncbi:MAG: gfo/Idh/MocA family oxidoreductase, partial [Lachnospiraceae bacterium]|nr:gfo/Idh/MocA family oxidoreductase [Lachnospiraceae bacterium]
VTGLKITQVFADFQTIHPYHKKPKRNVLAFEEKKDGEEEYELVPIDTEDNACVMFRFNNGAKGCAFFSQVIAGKSVDIDLLIGGYKKSANWNSAAVNSLTIGNRDSFNEVLEKGINTVHPETKPLIAYPFGHMEGFVDAFKQCFREVYESIDNKDKKYNYATFDDGVHEMILCDRIFQSSKEQRWIDVEK